MVVLARVLSIARASIAAIALTSPLGTDEPVSRTERLTSKKATIAVADAPERSALLGTIVDLHGDARLPLDSQLPTNERFAALLADRVTGESHELAPELLGLLRTIASHHPGARIELVSGYRSPKLNEMLRKKGHHVASKSQHSLGHACDFRIVPPGAERGIHPLALEREIRDAGWTGGVGTYLTEGDWFVHADVGPNRRWGG